MQNVFSTFALAGALLLTACGTSKNTTADNNQQTDVVVVPFTPESAQKDIKANNVRILLPGGIVAPAPSTKADEAFETKYRIQYYSQGCIHQEGEDEAGYNRVVFEHLDRIHGKSWRQEVRKDAVGIAD